MNNISLLLAEAKPLYFIRKRKKKQVRFLAGTFAFLAITVLFPLQKEPVSYESLNSLYADLYDTTVFEGYFGISEESSFQKIGLPTDEYGLLKVI